MILKEFQRNILLAPSATFKIGGAATYFYNARTSEQVIKAIALAQKLKIPYLVFGGMSNVLVSDQGFNGLVIKFINLKPKIKRQGETIIVEAGAELKKVVLYSIKHSLSGLEWAIGIPGALGGAVRGNAGTFGNSISDLVSEVKVLRKNKKIKLEKKELNFSYRDSLFKKNKDIMLEVKLEIKKGNQEKSKEMIKEYLKKRKEKQPLNFPSAGSVFKKVFLKMFDKNARKVILKEKPEFKETIPAGWLIEKCGLKGKKIGQAQISEKHANFIINRGKARAEEVIVLIDFIKQKVKNKFGIQLEEEIEYVGF